MCATNALEGVQLLARRLLLGTFAISAAVASAPACGAGDAPHGATPAPDDGTGISWNVGRSDHASITGAGATFPAPIYQAWFDDYHRQVAPGVKVNYQSIGSGGGIQQFTEKTVDFGATDSPMSAADLQKSPDAQHIPTVLGSVVVTYNLPAVKSPVKLDGPTVAASYLGAITKWNDPAIANQNPQVRLPDRAIQVVHRTDGSGTTFVLTDWLSKVSPEWKSRVGVNKNPNWPLGQGGKGNEGVTSIVKQTPYSIGYVELNFAVLTGQPFADVLNRAGRYVTPSLRSTAEAAVGVEVPEDFRVSITDSESETAYPIASFTYLLLRRNTDDCAKQRPLVNLLWWAFHDPSAAKTAAELGYAPLPPPILARVETALRALQCEGEPILPQP